MTEALASTGTTGCARSGASSTDGPSLAGLFRQRTNWALLAGYPACPDLGDNGNRSDPRCRTPRHRGQRGNRLAVPPRQTTSAIICPTPEQYFVAPLTVVVPGLKLRA